MIEREARALVLALGLLTRLPVPALNNGDPSLPGRSLHWYPAVGLVIALPLAGLALVLPGPPLLVAALVVSLWAAFTGALHLDGLADCADAWVGGLGDRDRTLAIMKDPACGPMAVIALVVVLLLKVAALATLLELTTLHVLWLAPLTARALLPVAFVTLPYLRAGGMGDGIATHASQRGIALSLSGSLLLCTLFLPLALLALWLVVALTVFLLWRRAMATRLGGFTGDGAGALVELTEMALLVACALYGNGVTA